MNVLLIPLVYIVTLIAELPDKSMFASLVLGTRFKARWVFLGVASAFVVHVVIAVTAGGLLTLLPHRVVEIIVAALFVIGAAYMWWTADHEEDEEVAGTEAGSAASEPGSSRPAITAFSTSFAVIFIGEWGDITQILSANLTAKYHDPVSVGIGAVLGLWTAALLAITVGRTLLRYISVTLLQRIGSVILLGFAVYTVVQIVIY